MLSFEGDRQGSLLQATTQILPILSEAGLNVDEDEVANGVARAFNAPRTEPDQLREVPTGDRIALVLQDLGIGRVKQHLKRSEHRMQTVLYNYRMVVRLG